ncbi:MAG: DeoR/GlpR transcriptional regulator [Lachnospiraceae bacterium]|nr:DeoR/GlpR transcriptional regulator [Lachnospiraceae bacterium]
MLSEERKAVILKKINEKKSVTVKELKETLNVSESSIRRTITELDREGLIIRVYGGAMSLEMEDLVDEPSVIDKEIVNIDEKQKIGQYAAPLIEPGDCVFLDAGTTTKCMINYITEKNATYVTNGVVHAKDLVKKGMKVILIGGELKENTEAVVGADAVLQVQKYHFSKGFFGTNGINPKTGFSTPDVREASIKRVAVGNTKAGERYILSDHDKFGKRCTVTFSGFEGTVLITDKCSDEIYYNITDVKIV